MSATPAARVLGVILAFAVGAPELRGQERPALAEGRRQLREGALDDALVTLDRAIQKLSADKTRAHDLALAYAYLAEVFLGLGQASLAEAKLLKALDSEPSLSLDAREFPRNVVQALEAARKVRLERESLGRQAKRKSRKGGVIALAAGGAAAIGVALVVVPKERENRPPIATVSASPSGTALVHATQVTFTAAVSDPDGEPVSVTWDFGDRGTAQGASASHVYASEGTFTVTATARDGLTSTTATTSVAVRSITGLWRPDSTPCNGESTYDIRQGAGGTLLVGVEYNKSDVMPSSPTQAGTVTDPRRVSFNYREFIPSLGQNRCGSIMFTGETDAAIQRITGTVSYTSQGVSCSCVGQQRPLSLSR